MKPEIDEDNFVAPAASFVIECIALQQRQRTLKLNRRRAHKFPVGALLLLLLVRARIMIGRSGISHIGLFDRLHALLSCPPQGETPKSRQMGYF